MERRWPTFSLPSIIISILFRELPYVFSYHKRGDFPYGKFQFSLENYEVIICVGDYCAVPHVFQFSLENYSDALRRVAVNESVNEPISILFRELHLAQAGTHWVIAMLNFNSL